MEITEHGTKIQSYSVAQGGKNGGSFQLPQNSRWGLKMKKERGRVGRKEAFGLFYHGV